MKHCIRSCWRRTQTTCPCWWRACSMWTRWAVTLWYVSQHARAHTHFMPQAWMKSPASIERVAAAADAVIAAIDTEPIVAARGLKVCVSAHLFITRMEVR